MKYVLIFKRGMLKFYVKEAAMIYHEAFGGDLYMEYNSDISTLIKI